ncbi:MAG: 50S ribosomal protein P1, partial [Methanomicrobiales archaeon]|nr:50S ribosomal protein P1 [Methanomicrobiales archaeon]
MEYIYAALLLHHAKKEIKEADVKAVLTAAGIAVNDARIKALVAALEGVNIEEAISKSAVAAPVAAVAAPAAAAPAAHAAAPAAEEKKKEDEKKEEEESGMAGL